MHDSARVDITPEILLKAYAAGIFPMAEDADDPTLYWVEPKARGVLPSTRSASPGASPGRCGPTSSWSAATPTSKL